MTFISTLCSLTAYGALFGVVLLARRDYRNRQSKSYNEKSS